MPAENKSRFPMKFEKCPYCGETETITEAAWAEEAEKGRVKAGVEVGALHPQVPLLDPKNPPKLVGAKTGILILKIDFCAGCGAGSCRSAFVAEGQVKAMPPGGGMPDIPPNRN